LRQQQQQQQATGGASTQAFASDPSSLQQQQQQQQATDGASASAFSPTGMPPHQPTAGLRSAFARAPSSLQQQQQQATGGASAQAFASDPSSLQQQQQQQQATGGASAQAFAQQPSTASRLLRFGDPLVTPPSASGRAPGGSGGSSGFGQAGSVGQQEPQAKIRRMSHYEAAMQVQDGDPFGDIASGGPGRATLLPVSGITPKLPDAAVAAVSRKKRKQASRDGDALENRCTTEGQQSDRYVAKELGDVEQPLKEYFRKITPRDMNCFEGLRRRVTVLVTMDELPQAKGS
jgi:hypothetical protein